MSISRRSVLRTAAAAVPALAWGAAAPTGAAAATARERSAPREQATPQWQVTPFPLRNDFGVSGLAMTGAAAGFAVGYQVAFWGPVPYDVPAVWSWDGARWTEVEGAVTGASGRLYAATAAGPADVWAVGDSGLAVHWDGQGWSRSTVPGTAGGAFSGFAVAGAGSAVWAVGRAGSSAAAARWNGSSWEGAALPLPPGTSQLTAVRVAGPGDVWAAGDYQASSGALYRPFVVHWDGSAWSQVAAPSYPNLDVRVLDLLVAGPSEVWLAGGTGRYSQSGLRNAFATRWDGTAWNGTRTPPATDPHYFLGLSLRGTEVWGVGYSGDSPVQRWTGSSWAVAPAPFAFTQPGVFTTGPDGTTWLFGYGAPDARTGADPFTARLPAS
ncbi:MULTISPECIES: hypothetical protein [Streptomycetaceae]|uniref:hypothetical protein n=1 Tax=Streptomycetaceae TaxID=2062 RepID=UPI00093FEEBF|nr:hypothetical protein [Streptomyces sp. CB02056]OKI11528.1 hypothetical protein AMK13_04025 [Streptomyces sp. CB02056]